MTDKVQKIREEVKIVISRRLNLLNGDYFDLNKEVNGFTNEIMDTIDSLQEEPVSEDLEEAAEEWDESLYRSDAFKAGAKWKKEQMMKNAISAKVTEIYYPTDSCLEIEATLPEGRFKDGDKVLIIKEG